MDNEQHKEAFRLAMAGGAVCFFGAGFSREAKDQDDKGVPSTSDLEKEIRDLIGHLDEETASLTDLADYANDDPQLSQKLRLMMIKRLTLTKPTEEQVVILNAPWRALFTTNFDDVIERGVVSSPLQIISPRSEKFSVNIDKLPVYYLHGRAKDLIETDENPSFVLSESNYIDLKEQNRNLYAQLSNEINCARAIFLIGYSLKDLEIAKIFLSSAAEIRHRTYIVCHPDDGIIARSRLKKFGTVMPIGCSGAAKLLSELKMEESKIDNPSFLREYKFTAPSYEASVDVEDIERLILSGAFDPALYSLQRSKAFPEDYCIDKSEQIKRILDNDSIKRFIVSSDIGNGKSIFLEQLALSAFQRGVRVYLIDTNINDIFDDLEKSLIQSVNQLYIIDDVVRYRNVAKFIGSRLNNFTTLVCSSRGEIDSNHFDRYSDLLAGAIAEIDLDRLSNAEIENWERLLERWGFWEQRISQSASDRIAFLRDDCNRENRSIILSVFRSSHVAKKSATSYIIFLINTPNMVEPSWLCLYRRFANNMSVGGISSNGAKSTIRSYAGIFRRRMYSTSLLKEARIGRWSLPRNSQLISCGWKVPKLIGKRSLKSIRRSLGKPHIAQTTPVRGLIQKKILRN